MSKKFRFVREELGMEFVEWALVAALFAIGGSAGFSSLAGTIQGTLATVGESVSVSASAAPAGSGAGSGGGGIGTGRAASLATAGATPPPGTSGSAPSPGELINPQTGGGGRPTPAQNTNRLTSFAALASLADAQGSQDVNQGNGQAPPPPPSGGGGIGGIVAGAVSGVIEFVADAAATANETGQGDPVPTSGSLGSRLGAAVGSALSSAGSTFNRAVKAQSDLADKDEKTKDHITRNIKG